MAFQQQQQSIVKKREDLFASVASSPAARTGSPQPSVDMGTAKIPECQITGGTPQRFANVNVNRRIGAYTAALSPGAREMLPAYVGFANIPDQVFRRAIKQGFQFNMIFVGRSGLGKSTFMNSLFSSELYPPHRNSPPIYPKTVTMSEKRMRLVESGVSVELTLVDTPGFGDAIDNRNCWTSISDYIDRKFEEYLHEETKVNRCGIKTDKRIHCCIYFIEPSGHGLKPLDVEFMRHLHEKVNIVPVVAKADTFTAEELNYFKKTISKELESNGIKPYSFPEPTDDDEKRELQPFRERVPFAVVGSNTVVEGEGGKSVRCRKYPWGVVEVENLDHNDFMALRSMIIRNNLIDLISVTSCVHYENYRTSQHALKSGSGMKQVENSGTPLSDLVHQRAEHDQIITSKREELNKTFEAKAAEKQRALKARQEKLMHEEIKINEEINRKRVRLEELKVEKGALVNATPQLASYMSASSIKSGGSENVSPDSHKPATKKTTKNIGGTLKFFGRNRNEDE